MVYKENSNNTMFEHAFDAFAALIDAFFPFRALSHWLHVTSTNIDVSYLICLSTGAFSLRRLAIQTSQCSVPENIVLVFR